MPLAQDQGSFLAEVVASVTAVSWFPYPVQDTG